jgi:hypothetical protein
LKKVVILKKVVKLKTRTENVANRHVGDIFSFSPFHFFPFTPHPFSSFPISTFSHFPLFPFPPFSISPFSYFPLLGIGPKGGDALSSHMDVHSVLMSVHPYIRTYVHTPAPLVRAKSGSNTVSQIGRSRARQRHWTTGYCPVKILLGPVGIIKHWTTWSSECLRNEHKSVNFSIRRCVIIVISQTIIFRWLP